MEELNQENATATMESEHGQEISALVEILESRSATYSLLARLYRTEVDEALLDDLHGRLYPKDTGDETLDRGYEEVATYLSNLWDDSLEELKVDYVTCFIGDGIDGHSAAYPFESVYTSEKRLLMQETRDEVLALYRSQGIDRARDWKEGEDHVALELEFMDVLSNRCAEALREGDERAARSLLKSQKDFLEDHLRSWVPMMTADLRRFARTGLYRGLADLTDGFLECDHTFLREVRAEPSTEKAASRP